MKDIQKCSEEIKIKMKVKNEDNTAVASEKDNLVTFEKKNNLSGNMTKEEQEAAKKGAEDSAKSSSDEAIDNLTNQVKEIKISNDLKDITDKVSDLHVSETDRKESNSQRQNSIEDDGKRLRSQSSQENDEGVQKRSNGELQARGPNGGLVRNTSCDSFNYNTCYSERKSCSNNKRTFSEDAEPTKYYRPVNDFNLSDVSHMMTIQTPDMYGGGIVNIKASPDILPQSEGIPFELNSLPEGDFADRLLADIDQSQLPNLGQNFNISTNNNLSVNLGPNNMNNIYTQENIIEEQTHSPYRNGGPPSNQSDTTDSGVSGMSYGSPYQEIHSPPSVKHNASPPHELNYSVVYSQSSQLNCSAGTVPSPKPDPLAGREDELSDAMSVITDELINENRKKQNKPVRETCVSMPKPVMSPGQVNIMTSQMNTVGLKQQNQPFQQQMNTRPVCSINTTNSMPPNATMFGQQPVSSQQIILPPGGMISQPSAVVHPIPVSSVGNPVMMVQPQGCPIPIGQMPPYTQPQIIIIQSGPVPAQKKPGFRQIAPKTEKPIAKKPGISPAGNKDIGQKQMPKQEQVPVMTVKPTPAQTPANISQRPPNNVSTVQKSRLLNMARRMVAEIPSEQLTQQDEEGDTYLHVAACRTDPNLIQALLERLTRENMDWLIDLENKKRMTPLYLAVLGNQPDMVEIFLKHGADPNCLAQSGSSDGKSMEVKAPIHVASSGGEESLATLKKLLVARDINLNIYNSEGHTALHTSIIAHGTKRPSSGTYINNMSSIETLIKAGADPNSQDKKSGKTPLMYAIEKRDCILIEKMLRLFDPKKLRNVVGKSQTFDGSTCLKIAEGRKSEFDPQNWQRLWELLNKACTGELPKTSLIVGAY